MDVLFGLFCSMLLLRSALPFPKNSGQENIRVWGGTEWAFSQKHFRCSLSPAYCTAPLRWQVWLHCLLQVKRFAVLAKERFHCLLGTNVMADNFKAKETMSNLTQIPHYYDTVSWHQNRNSTILSGWQNQLLKAFLF